MTDDKSPMYEGKDTSLLKDPRCLQCLETPATKLLRCSRCHSAWYCSTACQKAHYAGKHRGVCQRIAKFQKLTQHHEFLLRLATTENPFETEVGYFWELPQTQAYMEATYDLTEAYWVAARESQVKKVWEKTLFYLLENLRLGAIDHLGARLRAPFLLLALNRDDDAVSFIRYWSELSKDLNLALEQMHANSSNTKQGEWIYPRQTDCRYLDLYQITQKQNPLKMERPFLVALVIVKLRIVAAHEAALKSLELAMQGSAGQRIQEVRMNIKEMLVRSDVNVEREREHINLMLDVIHRHNPSMLPALINPKPIIDQPPPTRIIPGHPSEIYKTIPDCVQCFQRVPGAVEMLQERFGSNPVYNWRWS